MNKIVQEDLEIISNYNLQWEQFRDSTILVTGATGYIGSWIVQTLLYLNKKFDYNIRIIVSGKNYLKFLCQFKPSKNLIFIDIDLSENFSYFFQNVDFVIHAASIADPVEYTKNPVETIKVNTIGTINLLDSLDKENCKGFLFLSSGWANGILNDNQIPTKETDYGTLDTMDVVSCYGESKRMGENICASYYKQFGIPTKVARISYAYGPLMNLETDNRAIANFISSIIRDQKIVMNSNGKATRSFCYISDIITALFTILLKGNDGQVYNASNGEENTIMDVVSDLITNFSSKYKIELLIKNDNIFRPTRACLSGDKLKSLGWNYKYNLNQGLKRTVESYLNEQI